MEEKCDTDELATIIRAVGEHMDELYREYTEVYVKRLIIEAENKNEYALIMLEYIARQFSEISKSFNELVVGFVPKNLH